MMMTPAMARRMIRNSIRQSVLTEIPSFRKDGDMRPVTTWITRPAPGLEASNARNVVVTIARLRWWRSQATVTHPTLGEWCAILLGIWPLRMWIWGLTKACVLAVLLLTGCAEVTPPQGASSPLPDDLATWSAPTPVAEPTPTVPEAEARQEPPASKVEKVYPFEVGNVYPVPVPMGIPADVILEAGEQIRNVVGGNRAPVEGQEAPRWEVKEGSSGSDAQARPHVFVSATTPGLTMGVIVTTTKRTYYLTCKSVQQTPIRAVRWIYQATPMPQKPVVKTSILPDASQPQRYHVGYKVDSSQPKPAWTPENVVDDGRKVYILLPAATQYGDAPMVRLVGVAGGELVNSRQFKNMIIIDRIFDVAELRLGVGKNAEIVRITRGNPTMITCPDDPRCPIWPENHLTALDR